MTQPKRSRTDR